MTSQRIKCRDLRTRVFTSTNHFYRLSVPICAVHCYENRDNQCMTLPAGAKIRPVREIRDDAQLVQVKWEGHLVIMFADDFWAHARRS